MQLNREFQKTIVMVTHDPLAAQRASRTLHLDKGRLVDEVIPRSPDTGRAMKYLTYILRNARRNPVRSLLTMASTAICLLLMMILVSFFAISDEVSCVDNGSTTASPRLNANGFAGMMPIACVSEIGAARRRQGGDAVQLDRRQVPGSKSCRLRNSASIPRPSSHPRRVHDSC